MNTSQNFSRHSGAQEKFANQIKKVKEIQVRFWISLILTIPAILLSSRVQNWFNLQTLSFNYDNWVLLGLSTIVFIYGGWTFFKASYIEITNLNLGSNTLISFSIAITYCYSFTCAVSYFADPLFWEMCIIITLMLFGRIIELRCITAASKPMHKLYQSLPKNVHLVNSKNEIVEMPLNSIKYKDKLIVRPGEQFPADGIVIEGESTVNESKLTGKNRPVLKKKGSWVLSGSKNINKSITIETVATGICSYLFQVTKLVEDTPFSNSHSQNLTEKGAHLFTIISIITSVFTFLIWRIMLQQSLSFSLERMIAVMIISSPDVIVLVIPIALSFCASISASNGILIKSRRAFESARKIQSVIFDKTGTLTEGSFGVSDIEVFHCGVNRDELIKFAASVEIRSQHPVAQGIVQFSEDTFNATKFSYINGKGVSALVEGRDVKVVSETYLQDNNIHIDSHYGRQLREGGRTVAYVLINNVLYGAITLTDFLRTESRAAIKCLHQMGIKTVMITGDNRKVAKHIADELELDNYFAEVQQHEKVFLVKKIQNQGFLTAVTGDSISDATALAQADIGFAIGAGTDIKSKTADIVLVHNNPLDVVKAIKLSKNYRKKIIQNLLWAISFNIIAITVATGVLSSQRIILNPALSAALMLTNSLLIILNSRFLNR